MPSCKKTEQLLAGIFSLDNNVAAIVLDFKDENLDIPDREVWHQFENDVENVLDDCAIAICDNKTIDVTTIRYGFARWAGYYKSAPRYLVCVICEEEQERPQIFKDALSKFSESAEQYGIEIVYDDNRHLDNMMSDTEKSRIASYSPGPGRSEPRPSRLVSMKALPECLDDQKKDALAALSLNEMINVARVRASSSLISEVDQKTFVQTITFGRVNISELEALRNIPCWIARDLSVSPKLIPGLYEKCKQIIGCAAIWHETLSAAGVLGYDLGIDPETSKFDLDLFKAQTMETGVQYNVEAFLSGVPMADIIA